jgi:hypothetical protein
MDQGNIYFIVNNCEYWYVYMFVFSVNISIDLYVGYSGIESDVRGRRVHKRLCLHVVVHVQ